MPSYNGLILSIEPEWSDLLVNCLLSCLLRCHSWYSPWVRGDAVELGHAPCGLSTLEIGLR